MLDGGFHAVWDYAGARGNAGRVGHGDVTKCNMLQCNDRNIVGTGRVSVGAAGGVWGSYMALPSLASI